MQRKDIINLKILRLIGFEPITFGTEIQRSIQLSYKRRKNKMIQQRTILKIADNSGARTVRCIKVLGGFKKKIAKLGDIIIVSVQELRNKTKEISKVKKKDIYKGLIIRVKTKHKRKNGITLSFTENSIVLINKNDNPIGTRIIGPMPEFLKKKKYQKFINISSGLLKH